MNIVLENDLNEQEKEIATVAALMLTAARWFEQYAAAPLRVNEPGNVYGVRVGWLAHHLAMVHPGASAQERAAALAVAQSLWSLSKSL